MISDYLIAMLQKNFSGRGLVVGNPPNPSAVFPEIHPDVGSIKIYDDKDEVTLVAGNFTHGHFTNYEENLSLEQKHKEIAEEVVSFLRDLFDDRVVLWGSHEKGGGWEILGTEECHELEEPEKLYVWSGPWNGCLTRASTRPK
jgi:hypothetical protein